MLKTKYEKKNKYYKSSIIMRGDPFSYMDAKRARTSHQKYDEIAIVWNVGILEFDGNVLHGNKTKEMKKC